ncbi:MAG: secreted PhoX family phosphatase [Saprospiraceae bacterium]|jgi:secreted PhoX family phosphatase
MKRRKFIYNTGKVGIGFLGLQSLVSSCDSKSPKAEWTGVLSDEVQSQGYGPLLDDPLGILNLPKGFTYQVISKKGDLMDDGFHVPGAADGMASFSDPSGNIILVRNHELSPGDAKNGPFGKDHSLLSKLESNQLYDFGRGSNPCLGGTSTMVYDPVQKKVVQQHLSLAGTIRNCAGGSTPWNSWISCEENVTMADDQFEKNHGYNFEVPASKEIKLLVPEPLKAMGRFNHEAVCVDPKSGIVYQTEDRHDSMIYRFLPNEKGQLNKGGRLQILSIQGSSGMDTRNWKVSNMEIGKQYNVVWLDIDNVEAPEDDLRKRGAAKGGAIFARGEGMWFGNNECFFACTNGGQSGDGQIFRYRLSDTEGMQSESNSPGTLELFIEPNNANLVESCDNLTIGSNGDLILCEDKTTPRIVGVTPEGKIFHVAKNVGYKSEFAGATFSPDGKTLFVNIQGPGLTLAIDGPWGNRMLG